jgi:hypothetical protein
VLTLTGGSAGGAAAVAGGAGAAADAGAALSVDAVSGVLGSGTLGAMVAVAGIVVLGIAGAGAATSTGFTSSGLTSAAGAVDAVVSILKSLAVGGGKLTGSGRGTAASIASSAGLLRFGPCANADVADTVRKVAATAISTRSNPPRLFFESRIVTPLWVKPPRQGTVPVIIGQSSLKPARLPHTPARDKPVRIPGRYRRPFSADRTKRGNSRQTDFRITPFATDGALLPRTPPFVCHLQATVRKFCNDRRLWSIFAIPMPSSHSRLFRLN